MKPLQLREPYLIMVVGIPGSGKTSFATQFTENFQSILIDVKDLMSYGLSITNATKLAIKFLKDTAKTKTTVIFEGITGDALERTEISKLAKSLGYKPVIVWLQIDDAVAEDRLFKRSKREKKTFDIKKFDVLVDKFIPPIDKEKPIIISGMHTYNTQARTVLKHLAATRPRQTRATSVRVAR